MRRLLETLDGPRKRRDELFRASPPPPSAGRRRHSRTGAGGRPAPSSADRRALLFSVVTALVAHALFIWWSTGQRLMDDAPASTSWSAVSFTLAPGERRVLGRDDLGQRDGTDAADVAHLAFSADENGQLLLQNASRIRKVAARYGLDVDVLSGRKPLTAGDLIYLGSALVEVTAVDEDAIHLAIRDASGAGAVTITTNGWVGPRADRDGKAMRLCFARALDAVKDWFSPLLSKLPAIGKARRVATLGGRLDCVVRTSSPSRSPTCPGGRWRSCATATASCSPRERTAPSPRPWSRSDDPTNGRRGSPICRCPSRTPSTAR